MLFTYPADALACNWLNGQIIETLLAGMDSIDADGTPTAWPECLPEEKRHILRRQTALQPNIEGFWAAYLELSEPLRSDVRSAISQQTNIPELYCNEAVTCLSLDDLPDLVKPSLKVLAEYAYGKLATLKEDGKVLRDIHFEKLQESGVKVCPFCGLENFRPLGLMRNALDHLMPISRYPFVASDLRNLAPACHACNSLYKRDVDILIDDDGNRRLCSDPYGVTAYRVSLIGSEFEAGNTIGGYQLPRWEISLVGEPFQQAVTWDQVYKVKARYEATLDRDFISWIERFALWLVREDETFKDKQPSDTAEQIPRYISNVIQEGFADTSFLKAEAFEVLQTTCADPAKGHDAQNWLFGFVRYAT